MDVYCGLKPVGIMPIHNDWRSRVLGLVLFVLVLAPGHAQEDQPVATEEPTQASKLAAVEVAVEKWLADQVSTELMEQTVSAVLKDSQLGLSCLGKHLRVTEAMLPSGRQHQPRFKGIRSLATQVTLEFLRRTAKSEMTYVGQYDQLSLLQPFASEFLMGLLLATPDWYPFTFRIRLVPALRDIQLRLPSVDRVDGIVALINNQQESEGLRNALAAMMAQWGRTKYADTVVRRMREATMEGDGEDRIQTTIILADYYNVLRDYQKSAGAYRAVQALASGADVELLPVTWYASACVHALSGATKRAMRDLETCAQMHASPDLDSSLRLDRKLFESDPEIAALREDKRFASIVKLAFGDGVNVRTAKDGRK